MHVELRILSISRRLLFSTPTPVPRARGTGAAKMSTMSFFDGPGFHPRNGEPLKSFTKEAMQNWDREIREEKVRLDRENKKRADEEEKRKDDLAKKEAADKKARDD